MAGYSSWLCFIFLVVFADSHDSLNFGGVQSDMRPFGQQFHVRNYLISIVFMHCLGLLLLSA